jgi:arylsulfatase A-like enzyme
MGLLAVVAGGCRRGEPADRFAVGRPDRPDIVLVTLCTFRMAHTGFGGYDRNTTPFLDSLAASGVLFENATSASSWTKPSVTSLLTGLTPNVHGLTDMSGDRDIIAGEFTPQRILADDVVTLAECLKDAGYATASRVNNVQAGEFYNIGQGFDDAVTSHEMDTPAILRDFESWLARRPAGQPVFFFMLTRDAHMPYDPNYEYFEKFSRSERTVSRESYPGYRQWLHSRVKRRLDARRSVAPETQRQFIDLYDAELAQLDDALRALPDILERAGRRNRTLIVVIADHGERFFERGRIGHAGIPDEATIHVPLIFAGLDVPIGKRVAPVVRSIDVYPTLAALAGAAAPDVLQGTSLVPILYGPPEAAEALTAFASFMESHHTVRQENYKLHLWRGGRRSLYDLNRDPGEMNDVFAEKPDVAERLDQELIRWLDAEEALRAIVAQGGTRTLTPEVIEQLRSLGYIR